MTLVVFVFLCHELSVSLYVKSRKFNFTVPIDIFLKLYKKQVASPRSLHVYLMSFRFTCTFYEVSNTHVPWYTLHSDKLV